MTTEAAGTDARRDGFRLTLPVRADDLDVVGHVRGTAYVAYADLARWATVAAAGVELSELLERRIGPVNLETTLRFRREIRAGDHVEVVTVFGRARGKTSRVDQYLYRADGVLAAEVSSVGGLLDLDERRLLPDPDRYWLSLATDPSVLGLA